MKYSEFKTFYKQMKQGESLKIHLTDEWSIIADSDDKIKCIGDSVINYTRKWIVPLSKIIFMNISEL